GEFCRDRPSGRNGRAAHPPVAAARLPLAPDRVGAPRRHRARRSHADKARPHAALFLGRAGAASKTVGAIADWRPTGSDGHSHFAGSWRHPVTHPCLTKLRGWCVPPFRSWISAELEANRLLNHAVLGTGV